MPKPKRRSVPRVPKSISRSYPAKGLPGLKGVRIYRGLSQNRLAQLLEYSHGFIQKLECGLSNASQGFIEQLCRVLDCTYDDLMAKDTLLNQEVNAYLASFQKVMGR